MFVTLLCKIPLYYFTKNKSLNHLAVSSFKFYNSYWLYSSMVIVILFDISLSMKGLSGLSSIESLTWFFTGRS